MFDPDDWPGGYKGPGTASGPAGSDPAGSDPAGSDPADRAMRAALERLPPGHPSSAWNADGTRRPPPPRLQDLELPLPGAWADTPRQRNGAAMREPPAL